MTWAGALLGVQEPQADAKTSRQGGQDLRSQIGSEGPSTFNQLCLNGKTAVVKIPEQAWWWLDVILIGKQLNNRIVKLIRKKSIFVDVSRWEK